MGVQSRDQSQNNQWESIGRALQTDSALSLQKPRPPKSPWSHDSQVSPQFNLLAQDSTFSFNGVAPAFRKFSQRNFGMHSAAYPSGVVPRLQKDTAAKILRYCFGSRARGFVWTTWRSSPPSALATILKSYFFDTGSFAFLRFKVGFLPSWLKHFFTPVTTDNNCCTSPCLSLCSGYATTSHENHNGTHRIVKDQTNSNNPSQAPSPYSLVPTIYSTFPHQTIHSHIGFVCP